MIINLFYTFVMRLVELLKDILKVMMFTSGIIVYLLFSDKSFWREVILLLIAFVYACGCIHNSQFFRNVDKMAISAFFTGCSIYMQFWKYF